MYRKYLKTKDAAELMGVHPSTLQKWRARGCGPAFVRLGGMVRYLQEDLDAYVAASAVRSPPIRMVR